MIKLITHYNNRIKHMVVMLSIRERVDTINFNTQLKEVETLLEGAETKTSFFWGYRTVTAEGFTGSIPLNELVTKVNQKTWEFHQNSDLATGDRLSGIRVIAWLKEADSLGKNSYAPAQILIKTLVQPSLTLAVLVMRVCAALSLVFPFLKRPITSLVFSTIDLLLSVERFSTSITGTNLCAKRRLSDVRFRMYEKTKFLETFGGTQEDLKGIGGGLVEAKKESIEALLNRA